MASSVALSLAPGAWAQRVVHSYERPRDPSADYAGVLAFSTSFATPDAFALGLEVDQRWIAPFGLALSGRLTWGREMAQREPPRGSTSSSDRRVSGMSLELEATVGWAISSYYTAHDGHSYNWLCYGRGCTEYSGSSSYQTPHRRVVFNALHLGVFHISSELAGYEVTAPCARYWLDWRRTNYDLLDTSILGLLRVGALFAADPSSGAMVFGGDFSMRVVEYFSIALSYRRVASANYGSFSMGYTWGGNTATGQLRELRERSSVAED